jgi:hypothetical protein
MRDQFPWEVCPELTLDRLQLVAENLREVRHDALEIHDEEKGDDAQVHGTVAYVRSCKRLMDLAVSGKHLWLGIIDSSRRFIFSIGGIPMRMYRGDARRPPERSLRSYVAELLAMQMSLFREDAAEQTGTAGWFWRMAIETDTTGLVVRVVVFQVHAQTLEVRNPYEVPLRDGSITSVSPVTPITRPGKEIPPARVGKKRRERKDSDDKAQAEGDGNIVPFNKKNDDKKGEE